MLKLKIFTLFLLLFVVNLFSQNEGLKPGDALPNPVFSLTNYYDEHSEKINLYDYKKDDVLLVVLLPDISNSNPAAKIITTGIDAYFAEGLSFRSFEKYMYSNPELKVLIITSNNTSAVKAYMSKYDLNFDIAADENSELINFFGINKWQGSGDPSHIYISGKDNKIVYARNDFKGEGEKLKEIQSKLFAEFNLSEELYGDNSYPMLMQGDDAREFTFNYINPAITASGEYIFSEGKLSDYYGKKNVLVAFYPAPYSYSCAMEVTRFDTYAEERLIEKMRNYSGESDLELLMVSVSNYYILSKWKRDMDINNVKLVSDDNGEISMKYNSYDMMGWNKRSVFLINKDGKVQYIDWDYNVNNEDDFGILKEQLTVQK